jgi:hypothetical protein
MKVAEASPAVKRMVLQKEPYTVIVAALASPDEYFVEHVQANSPEDAVREAMALHPDLREEPYSIPAVLAGHHKVLYQG